MTFLGFGRGFFAARKQTVKSTFVFPLFIVESNKKTNYESSHCSADDKQ